MPKVRKVISTHNNKKNELNLLKDKTVKMVKTKMINHGEKNSEYPTINISYATNHNFMDLCLTSIVSVLENRINENINIILLYNDLNPEDFRKLNLLQYFYHFSLRTLQVQDSLFNDFPLVWTTKETWYRCLLADEFPEYDKILYLDCDTIVRKSLSSLWKTQLGNKLIAAVEDISLSKNKANQIHLRDNFFFNAGVLLLNTKEWRKQRLFYTIKEYVKNNEVFQADQGTLNIVCDEQKIRLMPNYNFMEVWWRKNECQYDKDDLAIYNVKDPTIVHFTGTKPDKEECKNSFKKEFLKYYSIIQHLDYVYLNQTDCFQKEIIVSLTSYPARINTVNQTIESILNQSIKADKVILWLAPEQFPNKEKDLPQNLLDLRSNGLTIDWYHDIKSYKKLIPALKKYPDALIVTADDDNIYPHFWLEKLYKSYLKYPIDIQAHRVTKFYFNQMFQTIAGGKEYYKEACHLNKLVGLGGVLYPPHCFYKDILDEDLIKELAPTNDDLWFWLQAALNGIKVRVVENPDIEAHYIHGTQETGLTNINDHGRNLFWKDFNRILTHYPKVKNILLKEVQKYNAYGPLQIPYKKDWEKWWSRTWQKPFNLSNPQTFNEKIQWIKLFDATPIKTRLADKYLVRDWVKEKIGEKYLIPLLGVYDKFEEIDFDKLPEKFVIKCNHGCAYNIIVKNKSKLDLTEVKAKLDKWMNDNFAYHSMEMHYRDIEPKIIIEKYIENEGTEDLYDYKFWCFDGKVYYIQFLSERNLGGLKMAFYDRNWQKQNFVYSYPLDEKRNSKPNNLQHMIDLAEKLSAGFNHVRVDFYRLNDGKVLFGEMTFTTASGTCKWNDEKINRYFGDLIKLPELAYNIDTGEYYKLPENLYLLTNNYINQTKSITKYKLFGFVPLVKIETV